MKLLLNLVTAALVRIVFAEESSILEGARVSTYDMSARLTTAGAISLIDENFATTHFSNIK